MRREPAIFIRIFRGRTSCSLPLLERHPKITCVAKDLIAVGIEAVEQVDVFDSSPFPSLADLVIGVERPASGDELVVAAPVGHRQRG